MKRKLMKHWNEEDSLLAIYNEMTDKGINCWVTNKSEDVYQQVIASFNCYNENGILPDGTKGTTLVCNKDAVVNYLCPDDTWHILLPQLSGDQGYTHCKLVGLYVVCTEEEMSITVDPLEIESLELDTIGDIS